MRRREFVELATAGAAAVLGIPSWARPSMAPGSNRRVLRLDTGWRFRRADLEGGNPSLDDGGWEQATLPHTARVEALVTGVGADPPHGQWQGICWYRRKLQLESAAGAIAQLRFEGAMNVAEVWLDGEHLGSHMGGYLPFVLDLGQRLADGREHLLAVRLDNRDNAVTGPKPLAQLDFNMYGGLYRPVYLMIKDRLHITDALLARQPASGGVFVTYPDASRESATVRVQTHVRNAYPDTRTFRVRTTLRSTQGDVVAGATTEPRTLAAGADMAVLQELVVRSPGLWSPAEPNLHQLDCELMSDGGTADAETVRIGIRRIAIAPGRFSINGETLFLRGTNRHQEYPYIGYALSDAAQHREAWKIKEAGFDYVRLSHYAHSPAFMDACDELGLVVMNCIPGWQYFNRDPAFAEVQYRNCRDLMRRDRNHPCVALWEMSLNETWMPPEFISRAHDIAHREYPGDQCFTAGWMRGYDVFIQARQHGGCRAEKDDACLVSEYGDWEYYAMNAGLDQTGWRDLTPAQSNSRQLRWQGERALLQQASNFQEAHNDDRSTIAFADGLWVMFDYNRGYAPDIESSGCMDIFRLPKFSYHFFRSQRDAGRSAAGGGSVVFIASNWTPASALDVRVFSNCNEVELLLNGHSVGRGGPDRGRMSNRLAHPPFTFHVDRFRPGTLEAVGYVAGQPAARHAVTTPGAVEGLSLTFDTGGHGWDRMLKDVIFCYAALHDAGGTVVPDAWQNIAFGVTGDGVKLTGRNPLATDAGIASILVETEPGATPPAVHALAIVVEGGTARIFGSSLALAGKAPRHELRYTTEGAKPGPASPPYRGPIAASPDLRAALLVGDHVVASLAASAPRYRVPASAPPKQREPFRH